MKQPTFSTPRIASRAWVVVLAVCAVSQLGCQRQPGYYPPGVYPPAGAAPNYQVFPQVAGPAGPASVFAAGQTAPQLVELQRRAQELDNNNRQLTAQLAQIQQQATAYRERSELLARQLEDANRQNSQLMASAQQYATQARSLQASMESRGSARLTANSSLSPVAGPALQIPGAQVLQDANGIRVRMSADQMFAPGTAQLNPMATTTLDSFAQLVQRQYPRQRIGVEAHTDATGLATGGAQLAGAQAQSVVDYLSQRGGISNQQITATVPAANFPIADNQTPTGRAQNRRIELVIYAY